MAGVPQPLDNQFAIVDERGIPTRYFTQWAQQRQIDIQNGITAEQAAAIVVAYLNDHPLLEGNGIDLTNSGKIPLGVTISANVQEILNALSTTQGTIIFRGAAAWQALAPGTAGHFLKTNGAGADPTWSAGAGGGGGSPWPQTAPTLRGVSTGTASAASVVVTLPVGCVAGDDCYLFANAGNNILQPTVPAGGWAWYNNVPNTAWNCAVLYKRLTASEISAGSITVPASAAFRICVHCIVFQEATGGARLGGNTLQFNTGSRTANFAGQFNRTEVLPKGCVYVFGYSTRATSAQTSTVGTAHPTITNADGSQTVWTYTPAADGEISFDINASGSGSAINFLRMAVYGVA